MAQDWLSVINSISSTVLSVVSIASIVLSIQTRKRIKSFEEKYAEKSDNIHFHEKKPEIVANLESVKADIIKENIGHQTLSNLVVAITSATYFAKNSPFSDDDISELKEIESFVQNSYYSGLDKFNWSNALSKVQRVLLIIQKGDYQ